MRAHRPCHRVNRVRQYPVAVQPLKTPAGTNAPDTSGNTMTRPNLRTDQRGATAIEYGLIAALIALASLIAFQMLGLNLANIFTTINDALN
jgi:pilus assembly protein Flp/PilA